MIYTAIDTFYLSQEQLANSPSRRDGIDGNTENLLRLFGCELIQESGILLKLPQAVMATGQVLFHRFFCKKSFAKFNAKRVAASCLWLAAKLEESPRRIAHFLHVFHRMECRRENKPLGLLDPFSKKYEELKLDLIRTERHLLKEMGFICHVEHPHKFILNYLSQLQAPPELMQEAWNLANDSLRTTLSVRFKSEVVACGVVYAAARRFKVSLPENPPWWKVFNAEKDDIDEVCRVLANLHRQPKAKYLEVGKNSKSFVLTSTAWDPPRNVQDYLVNSSSAERKTQRQVTTLSADGVSKDKSKSSEPDEEVRASTANAELTDDTVRTSREHEEEIVDGSREGGIADIVKEKDKDRSRYRKKDRDSKRVRDGERDKAREKDTEKPRECVKDRHYHSKERSKDLGYSDTRHRMSSRERDHQISYKIVREKERHRHHPYA